MSRQGLGLVLGAAAGLSCIVLPMGLSAVQAHDAPPSGARPGECYGKVILPPVYGTASRKVLEREAWVEKVPGRDVVEKTARRVLVRPARTEKVRTPAVYRTEVSWIRKPGARRWVSEPSRYRIVREKVLLEPGHAEWRRTDAPLAYGESAPGQRIVHATGEVVCRVWVPARYGWDERKVLISKGRSYEVVGPPRKQKVVRRVKVKEAALVERRVPAVYRTEYVTKGVRRTPGAVVEHPPVYRTAETPTVIKPERGGWARVVCGGVINPAFMARVQSALIAEGFDPGPPDGYGRAQTYQALKMFQRQRGLAQGQLTVESARALGVL